MTWNPPDAGILWMVSAVIAVAGLIDGLTRKVPNWLTYPFALAGLAFAMAPGGLTPLESLGGLALGLVSLLPLYAIGGMGAGDVKLMAAMGAWIGPALMVPAFLATALVGGMMGLVMMAISGQFFSHWFLMLEIGREIAVVRDPVKLSALAETRKATRKELRYGIPIALGSIAYFAWAGLLLPH